MNPLLSVSPLFFLFCFAMDGTIAPVMHLYDLEHQLNHPSDVTVFKDGTVYVVDGLNHCIKKFDKRGGFVASFGQRGSGHGDFESPLGIALGASGRIYVADSGNRRIQFFDAQGVFQGKIDIPPGENHAADPTDVVVDESNDACFVVDNDNHRILHYRLSTAQLVNSLGTPGTLKEEFNYPFMIARDRDRRLYVVEVINTRVQVLNPTGTFLTFIGAWGAHKGQLYRPKGVALDGDGLVYISDSYLGVIQVFDSSGTFEKVVGDFETGEVKKFSTPMGLFVDGNRKLYVVEMVSSKVSVYQLIENGDQGQ